MTQEIFKKISGFDNYEISDLGRVFNVKSGKYVSSCKRSDYYCVNVFDTRDQKRKTIDLHRLIAIAFITKPKNAKNKVDHIDGNVLNNDVNNLRWATHQENCWNRKKNENTKFDFKGVKQNNRLSIRFQARIKLSGDCFFVGTYRTVEEAVYAYNVASKQLHGEFGRLNDVERPTNYKQVWYKVFKCLSNKFAQNEYYNDMTHKYRKYA